MGILTLQSDIFFYLFNFLLHLKSLILILDHKEPCETCTSNRGTHRRERP